MDLFDILVLALCALGMVFCIWALVCNNRTYKQRSELLNSMSKDIDQFWYQMSIYQSVSYDKHFWTLMRFGNAKRLYKIK